MPVLNPNTSTSATLIVLVDSLVFDTDRTAEMRLGALKQKVISIASRVSHDRGKTTKVKDSRSPAWRPALNHAAFKFLQSRQQQQSIILVTTSPKEKVEKILRPNHVTGKVVELQSSNDIAAIKGLAADKPFDLMAGPDTSPELWQAASQKYLATVKSISTATTDINIEFTKVFPKPAITIRTAVDSLRCYQWLKNLLVFVPLVAAQALGNLNSIVYASIMFCCFCLVSSLGYVVNDILDIQADRAHPTKQYRPFASGILLPEYGLIICPLLLAITVTLASVLPPFSLSILMIYLALTLSYSLYLKTRLMLDVVALGATFTLRVIGGAIAIDSNISFYLLSFSIFLFSSLSLLKRFSELNNLRAREREVARGRGYQVADIETVRAIGIALGCMSAFILGQYINSPVISQLYSHPQLIWVLFPLLLYWLGRIWILAGRGLVNEDPLLFALHDRASLIVLLAGATVVFLAN